VLDERDDAESPGSCQPGVRRAPSRGQSGWLVIVPGWRRARLATAIDTGYIGI
jgi:hypothetical protein